MDANLLGFGAMILMAILFFVWNHYQDKKRNDELAIEKAKQDAVWAADYHNPASANYDPVAVANEAAAAAAAWANSTDNPDSPNYIAPTE
jgi:hypothetical protein